jgi:hypothetical protein
MTNPGRHIDIDVVFGDGWTDFIQLFDENDDPMKLVALGATSRIVVVDADGGLVADLTDANGKLVITNDGKITIAHTWDQRFVEADWTWFVTFGGFRDTLFYGRAIMDPVAGDDL